MFIDTQLPYTNSAKNLYGSKYVNFTKLLSEIVSDRILYQLSVIKTETKEESNFFDALVKSGIETKIKDLQTFSSGAKKGDWDVGMAVDAIGLASKIDVAVFATGDGDLIPVVEYLKFTGCQVEIATFKQSCSSNLIHTADDFLDLSMEKRKFLIK